MTQTLDGVSALEADRRLPADVPDVEPNHRTAADVTAVEVDRWTPVEIDRLRQDDWRVLRAARLRALCDSPDAFVATLAVEKERTSEEWIASIESSIWVVAKDGIEVVGIACLAAIGVGDGKEWFIESVWVTRQLRRQGCVRKMLRRLEEEARADGAEYLKLWVLETNDVAYDAYLKLDFYPVPDRDQPSWKQRDDGIFEQERLMVKLLL